MDGYCLPKDTKQLLANFNNVPQNLIRAIVRANVTRKKHILKQVLLTKPKIIGIYRLTMKTNSDNFRSSAIHDIIKMALEKNVKILIYEPTLDEQKFNDCKVEKNFEKFCIESDIILANRYDNKLDIVKEKVYTRDLFARD